MSGKVLQTIFQRQHTEKSNANRITICGERVSLCEFIKNRLYFVTLSEKSSPKDSVNYHYFSTDNDFVYLNYASDFGPLNLSSIAQYFDLVNTKLSSVNASKRIVHYTSPDPHKRANAAFLITAFAVFALNKTPKEAYQLLLVGTNHKPFKPFQDAAPPNSTHLLRILDCLSGLDKAKRLGFIRFEDFNASEYDFFSYIRHGDLNWIVPKKLIAFSGPVSGANSPYRPPEDYIKFFKDNGVSTIIRLNKRAYDERCFTAAGLVHKELYFLDGSCPPNGILQKFFHITENAPGAVAVHCKAGLGRTGSLIGAYLIKHYQMTAKEAIAWMRIVRPGCVIGHQQTWLEDLEDVLWAEGDKYRSTEFGDPATVPYHRTGINSFLAHRTKGCPQNRPKVPVQPHQEPNLASPQQVTNNPVPKTKGCPQHHPIADAQPGTSIRDKSGASQSQPSVKSLFYTPEQRGRRHAYVSGKVAGSIPNVVSGRCVETVVVKEDRKQDTQGDRLRRAKANREKWRESQGATNPP